MKKEINDVVAESLVEGLIKKNAINMVHVGHDDWCAFLKNQSKDCNCNPDIDISVKE